ncbi:MAG: class I SAM-dependent methyltransferase [Desulfobacteraceae bacterium]|nr:MAG: class I SAM-dependent methyltransferase [Desulfobacteraceae bacterium]
MGFQRLKTKERALDWSVMIVGGGPAGISTWLHLKKYAPQLAGRSLLIEKAVFPRDKLCAGGVGGWSADVLKHLEVELDIPSLLISHVEFRFEKEIYHLHRSSFFQVVKRMDFDHALAKTAKNRGLELHEDEMLIEVTRDRNRLIVETNKRKYSVQTLVGADGALSVVRRKMMPPQRPHLVPTLQIFAPANPPYDSEFSDKKIVIDLTPIKVGLQGYVYHFPCLRDGVPSIAHGMGDVRIYPGSPRADMKKIFGRELRSRNIHQEPKSWSSHPIRWLSPEDIVSQPNVILVGDAAGIEPAFGGGIHLALSYGEVAAQAIIDAFQNNDFSFHDYKQRLQSHLVGKHIRDCTRAALEMFGGRMNPLNVARDFFTNRVDSSYQLFPMKDKSEQYYNETYGDYALNWSKDHLHYGFWYEDTKTHEESLVNTVKEVVNYLDLKPGERLLDAGCGVGGTCRYIVENMGIETVGITLSKRLLDAANELSKDIKNRFLLKIYLKDFNDTGFEDSSFDKILGLESICHAENKEVFAREAYRLLKEGGRLVVADSFQVREDLSEDEERMYGQVLEGWAIPNKTSVDKFRSALESGGFTSIKCIDQTSLIQKSSRFMHDGSESVLPLLFRLVSEGRLLKSIMLNNIAGSRQKTCLDLGIWGYKIFVAEKE